MKVTKQQVVIILIFTIAIFSRIYLWPNTINEINCDEAMTAINAKAISETGKDMYGTSWPVYFETWLVGGQSAMLTYFMALSIKLFTFSTFAVRLPMLIISIISLYIFYKLIDLIFENKKITIITLLILAINPWHIMQTQWALDCNLFPHFILMAVYMLTKGIKENKTTLIYFSMGIFGISTYSYGVALYAVPIFLIIYMIVALKNEAVTWKEVIISALIVSIFTLPLIIMTVINLFDLDNISIGGITIQKFQYFTRTNDMILFSDNILIQICKNIKALFKILVLNYDGLKWNAIYGIGTIYVGSIIFAIIGLVLLIKDQEIDKNAKNPIIIWTIVSLLIGVLINNVNINRLNVIWYPIILLIGFGLYKVWEKFNFNKKIIAIIIIIYTMEFTIFNIDFYRNHVYRIENSSTWSKGFKDAVVYTINSKKNIIIDTEILNSDRDIIFGIYLSNYNFKKYGFLKKDILLENYLNYGNSAAIEAITKNEKIDFQNYDGDILDNCIYIKHKLSNGQLVNNNEYEIKEFNNFYTITKK